MSVPSYRITACDKAEADGLPTTFIYRSGKKADCVKYVLDGTWPEAWGEPKLKKLKVTPKIDPSIDPNTTDVPDGTKITVETNQEPTPATPIAASSPPVADDALDQFDTVVVDIPEPVDTSSDHTDESAMPDHLSDTITEAIALGNISIMPPRQDGSKRPYTTTWTKYQKQKPNDTELSEWYSHGLTGIGYICGAVSDNLEVIDFDERGIYGEWRQAMIDGGLANLLKRLEDGYLEHSPNGVHLFTRCSDIGGNTKLAARPKLPDEMKDENDKIKTLIETRGEGGYIISAPSSGTVHPEVKTYTLISGSLSTIPVITPEERRDIQTVARIFQEDTEEKIRQDKQQASEEAHKQGGLPGDDFNERGTWSEILDPHGWVPVFELNGVSYLRRPGKTNGISATIGHGGRNLFHNFSSSTTFQANKSYSKFGALAVLNFNGNHSDTAEYLRQSGYGKVREVSDVRDDQEKADAEQRASNSFPVIPFPLEMLPDHLQHLIDTYSKALQCSPAFMAMNFITVVSGAAGNSVTLAIKRSWLTAPFIWFGIVDVTGSGKTHPIDAAMKPLHKLQAVDAVRHEKDMQEYKQELSIYMKDKKNNDPPTEPNPMRHYYSGNFTIEALIPMFKASSRGLVLHVDELAGLLKGLNQYKSGKGSDDEQFLSFFNCGPLKSDRKSGGGFCRESGGSAIGGIQPGILPIVFSDKEHANGMVYRFLPMLMNASPPEFSEDDISQADEDTWSKLIDWMYDIPAPVNQITGFIEKQRLIVEDSGKVVWKKFHDEMSQLQPFMPKRFRGYIPKLITYCLKFMAVLHLLECYPKNVLALTVNKSTVEGAVTLTRFFAGQALQLVIGADKEQNPYRTVIRKALISLKGDVVGGRLFLARIRDQINGMLPTNMALEVDDHKQLAAWLRDMGLTVTPGAGNKAVVIWEAEKIFS